MARLNESHLEKLADAFFEALEREDRCEYGGWGLDDKRPFGNSDVEDDILEIIGETPDGDDGYRECWSSHQKAYAADLYDALGDYLRRRWNELKGK